jgi:SAM-dependent methyltransferase
MLDWAAGSGRHSRLAAGMGYEVLALDQRVPEKGVDVYYPNIQFQQADLEAGAWPLAPNQKFDVIVVCNYLFRSRLALFAPHLAPGGLFVYETFAAGNEVYGRPSNPNFLLQAGELFRFCEAQRWHVLGFEDGVIEAPKPARVQRVAAVRLPAVTNDPLRAMKTLAL